MRKEHPPIPFENGNFARPQSPTGTFRGRNLETTFHFDQFPPQNLFDVRFNNGGGGGEIEDDLGGDQTEENALEKNSDHKPKINGVTKNGDPVITTPKGTLITVPKTEMTLGAQERLDLAIEEYPGLAASSYFQQLLEVDAREGEIVLAFFSRLVHVARSLHPNFDAEDFKTKIEIIFAVQQTVEEQALSLQKKQTEIAQENFIQDAMRLLTQAFAEPKLWDSVPEELRDLGLQSMKNALTAQNVKLLQEYSPEEIGKWREKSLLLMKTRAETREEPNIAALKTEDLERQFKNEDRRRRLAISQERGGALAHFINQLITDRQERAVAKDERRVALANERVNIWAEVIRRPADWIVETVKDILGVIINPEDGAIVSLLKSAGNAVSGFIDNLSVASTGAFGVGGAGGGYLGIQAGFGILNVARTLGFVIEGGLLHPVVLVPGIGLCIGIGAMSAYVMQQIEAGVAGRLMRRGGRDLKELYDNVAERFNPGEDEDHPQEQPPEHQQPPAQPQGNTPPAASRATRQIPQQPGNKNDDGGHGQGGVPPGFDFGRRKRR